MPEQLTDEKLREIRARCEEDGAPCHRCKELPALLDKLEALRAHLRAAEIEELAAVVHEAYLDTCARLGWDVKPENRVAYDELSEESKELDRATARAVLARLNACTGEDQ